MEESVGQFNARTGKGRGFTAQGGIRVQPAKAFTNTRSVYDQVLERSKQLGLSPPTPGYLRLEQSINTTTGSITFPVRDNEGSPTVTERRLKVADSFTPLQWGLFLSRTASAAATPTPTEYAKQVLYTYPESKVFSAAGEAATLMNVYNGYTSLRIGSDIIIDSFPNYKFYRVPEAQQGMQFATTAAGVTIQNGGWPNPDWGYLNMTPTFTIMGSQTIVLTSTFPMSLNMAAAAASFNNLVLLMYGFLTQDGATFNTSGKKTARM